MSNNTLPYHTIPYHTQIFNLALDTGIVPTDWCIGLICTIYKNKGQHNDPDNYRRITQWLLILLV